MNIRDWRSRVDAIVLTGGIAAIIQWQAGTEAAFTYLAGLLLGFLYAASVIRRWWKHPA